MCIFSLIVFFLQVLYENGVNGILGDEMGLGKTVQCIAFVALLMQNGVKGPFLVVAPLSTLPNWVSEFKRFSPMVGGRRYVVGMCHYGNRLSDRFVVFGLGNVPKIGHDNDCLLRMRVTPPFSSPPAAASSGDVPWHPGGARLAAP